MKFELVIRNDANGAEDLLVLPGEGTLGEYAEFIRSHLDCAAVVVTIAQPFASLLDGDAGAGASIARSQVCAFAAGSGEQAKGEQALADPARLADPIAAGDLGFGFYAGLPLRLSSGCNLGMLAAVDCSPRRLAKNELATLKMLANIVVQIIELRLVTNGPGESGAA